MKRNFREKEPYAFTFNDFNMGLPNTKEVLSGPFLKIESVLKLARETDSIEDALAILRHHFVDSSLRHYVGPQVAGILEALQGKSVDMVSTEDRDAEWADALEKIEASDVILPSDPEEAAQLAANVNSLDERAQDLESLLTALVDDHGAESEDRDSELWDDARAVSDSGRSWKWLNEVREACRRLPSEQESRIRELARRLPPETAKTSKAHEFVAAQVKR